MHPFFRSQVSGLLRAGLQRVGAHAVDQIVWHLGLGRQGIRLTESSLGSDSTHWEVEVSGWRASVVAEAAEVIVLRGLSVVFDLAAEAVVIQSLRIDWLASSAQHRDTGRGGKIFLDWSLAEREAFRRDMLASLTSGAVTQLTVFGCDHEGLSVVQVELEVRAMARRQILGAKNGQ